MDTTASYAKSGPGDHHGGDCTPVPEFRRNQFVYGQLMGVADFRAEQSYFREKQRLHNRCLHGYGVVCGLLVQLVDEPGDCPPGDANTAKEEEEIKTRLADVERKRKQTAETDVATIAQLDAEIARLKAKLKELTDLRCTNAPPTRVVVDCGIALDCEGNELVVRRPLTIDLWRELSVEDRKRAGDDPQTLYVSLCYCEQPIDPIRPVRADQCGVTADCAYGKLRESVRVKVSLASPEADTRCETCCSGCGESCLLLARIDGFVRGAAIKPGAIHNEVRRRLTTYQAAVITGINWVHGGDYLADDAERILGTESGNAAGGIEIHFSHPILASSLQRGVVELWRIEGGQGRAGQISEISGEFVLDGKPETTALRYRQTDEEQMNYGDRILIQVRCAFLLDHCCRPVDGAHIGGRVPALPGSIQPRAAPPAPDCVVPPWGYAPWTSGSGVPGSSFESWFTIAESPGKTKSGVKR